MLALATTGILSQKAFLGWLSGTITNYEATSGRASVRLCDMDIAVWAQPIESLNRFDCGATLLLLLDVETRPATNNRRSLDDVVRRLNEAGRRSAYSGYTDDELMLAFSATASADLRGLYASYVARLDPIDYPAVLGRVASHVKVTSEPTGARSYAVRRANGAQGEDDFLKLLLQRSTR